MCKKLLIPTAIAVITLPFSQTALASAQWDYLELGYTFDGELDVGEETLDYKGYNIDASTSFNSDAFFFRGQATSYATTSEDVLIADTDITVTDWLSIGPGLHHTSQVGGMDLDIWGQFTLNRAAFIAVATKGVGAAVGARLNITPKIETSLSYRFANTERRYNNGNTSFDPSLWTLEALYHVTPSSAIRLAYSDGTADVEGSPLTLDPTKIDISEVQLGYRYVFGAAGKAAREEPKPLSFNFVQFEYVFGGDAALESGNTKLDFDVLRGYSVKGAFEFCHMFYFGGEVLNVDYEGSVGGPDEEIFSVSDMAFFGPGAHIGVDGVVQAYAQIGLQRTHYLYVPLDGYGIKLGAKAKAGIMEFNLWYQQGDTDGEISNETLTLKPKLYGAEVAVEFSPNAPELVLGYMSGKLEGDLDDGITTIDIEPDNTSIGFRQRF